MPVRPRGLTSDEGVHCQLSQVCERQIICEDFDLTGGTERFMRESGTLTATGAPPSRQMRGRRHVRWARHVQGARLWWRVRHGGRRKGQAPIHTDTGKGRSSRGVGAGAAARCEKCQPGIGEARAPKGRGQKGAPRARPSPELH